MDVQENTWEPGLIERPPDHLSRLMMGVEAAECIANLRHGNWPDGAVVNAEIRDGWTW